MGHPPDGSAMESSISAAPGFCHRESPPRSSPSARVCQKATGRPPPRSVPSEADGPGTPPIGSAGLTGTSAETASASLSRDLRAGHVGVEDGPAAGPDGEVRGVRGGVLARGKKRRRRPAAESPAPACPSAGTACPSGPPGWGNRRRPGSAPRQRRRRRVARPADVRDDLAPLGLTNTISPPGLSSGAPLYVTRPVTSTDLPPHPARFGHQAGIVRLADRQFRGVIARDPLNQIERPRPADFYLPHVAYIKEPSARSDRLMLG